MTPVASPPPPLHTLITSLPQQIQINQPHILRQGYAEPRASRYSQPDNAANHDSQIGLR